jgi:hypothetical protein
MKVLLLTACIVAVCVAGTPRVFPEFNSALELPSGWSVIADASSRMQPTVSLTVALKRSKQQERSLQTFFDAVWVHFSFWHFFSLPLSHRLRAL